MVIRRSFKLFLLWAFIKIFFVQVQTRKAGHYLKDESSSDEQSRIHGGQVVENRPYKSIVSLQIYNRQAGAHQHICGGVLIREDIVLTAAHCLEDDATKITSDYLQYYGGIMVVLGTNKIGPNPDVGITIRNVKNYRTHPSYDYRIIIVNDIALLLLDGLVDLNGKTVDKVDLSDKDEKALKGAELIASGWGTTELGGISNVLKETKMEAMDFEECLDLALDSCPQLINEKWKAEARRSTICVKDFKTNSSIGSGDSGGPLYYKNGDKLELVGIASYSPEFYQQQDDYFAAFTKVSEFKNWIDESIKDLKKNSGSGCFTDTPESKRCVFPYVYKGKLYHKCIERQKGLLMCPTSVFMELQLNAVDESWQKCNQACKKLENIKETAIEKMDRVCYTTDNMVCHSYSSMNLSEPTCKPQNGKMMCPINVQYGKDGPTPFSWGICEESKACLGVLSDCSVGSKGTSGTVLTSGVKIFSLATVAITSYAFRIVC